MSFVHTVKENAHEHICTLVMHMHILKLQNLQFQLALDKDSLFSLKVEKTKLGFS